MSHIIKNQRELKGRITRTFENLKKLGANNLSKGNITSRLEALRKNWSKFEAQHDALAAMADEPRIKDDPYFTEIVLETVEETFLIQEAQLLDKLDELDKREKALARTLERVSSEAGGGRTKTSLPKIPLPTFDGQHKSWPSFQGLFKSLVIQNTTLANAERLHYLRGALTGDAEKLIRNMPMREENFEAAWKLLEGRYDNQRLSVKAIMSDLFNLPTLTRESGPDLKNVYYTLCNVVEGLATLKRPFDATGDWLVHLVAVRLDPQSCREWETSIAKTTTPPTFTEMRKFLEARINTVEALEESSKGPAARPPRSTHTA